jgi:hypothetical protein
MSTLSNLHNSLFTIAAAATNPADQTAEEKLKAEAEAAAAAAGPEAATAATKSKRGRAGTSTAGTIVNSPISSMDSLLKETKKESDFKFEVTESATQDVMSELECLRVMEQFANNNNVTIKHGNAGITKLVQDGGTNQSKKSLTVEVGNVVFDITSLRNTIQLVKKGGTVRQFAKGSRDLIAKIASINSWPGPLTKDLKRINPDLDISQADSVWCNEIHTDNHSNKDCPTVIRDALIRREEQLRFSQKNAPKAPRQQAARGGSANRGRRRGKGRRN